MTQIVIPQWLAVDREVRQKIVQIFSLPMTGNTEVVDNQVVCDGYTHEDLKQLTSAKIAGYLGIAEYAPDEADIHTLFAQLVNKISFDTAQEAAALESFANNLGTAAEDTKTPAAEIAHVINEQDMVMNPELAQHDVKVGDEVKLPADDQLADQANVMTEKAPELPELTNLAEQESEFHPSQPPIEPSNTQAYKADPPAPGLD